MLEQHRLNSRVYIVYLIYLNRTTFNSKKSSSIKTFKNFDQDVKQIYLNLICLNVWFSAFLLKLWSSFAGPTYYISINRKLLNSFQNISTKLLLKNFDLDEKQIYLKLICLNVWFSAFLLKLWSSFAGPTYYISINRKLLNSFQCCNG